ncbi:MAG: hypothetical protein O2794_01510 [bacterium]|nr:hypothetical protein [bacterium]
MKKEWRHIEQMWWGVDSHLNIKGAPHKLMLFVVRRPESDLGRFGGTLAGTNRVYALPVFIDIENKKHKSFEMLIAPKDFKGDTRRTGPSFFSPKLSLRKDDDELVLIADLPVGDLRLTLKPEKDKVPLFGSPDHDPNSMGFVYPRLAVSGTLNGESCIDGTAICEYGWSRVVPMNCNDLGCRWIHVQLNDKSELIMYIAPWEFRPGIHGIFIDAQGMFQVVREGEYSLQPGTGTWISPKTGEPYPTTWHFRSEKLKLDIHADVSFPGQEVAHRRLTSLWIWNGSGKAQGVRGQHNVEGNIYFGIIARQWWPKQLISKLLSPIYSKK